MFASPAGLEYDYYTKRTFAVSNRVLVRTEDPWPFFN